LESEGTNGFAGSDTYDMKNAGLIFLSLLIIWSFLSKCSFLILLFHLNFKKPQGVVIFKILNTRDLSGSLRRSLLLKKCDSRKLMLLP
jgi:hypothetical protein